LDVSGVDSAYIGAVAARAGIALVELTPQQASLEEAFMEITRDSVEFATPDPTDGGLALAGRSSS
jgi:ABC-2 type transport system ATP-binding protein